MVSVFRARERPVSQNDYVGTKTRITHFTIGGNEVSGFPQETVSYSGTYPEGHETCHDKVTLSGEYKPHDLDITRREGTPCSLSGTYTYPANPPATGFWYEYSYNGYYNSRMGSMWNTGIPVYTPENPDYWLAQLLEGLSLTKPVVDIPLFVWELRDFPRLLKHMGDTLSALSTWRKTGGVRPPRGTGHPSDHWLAYHFGWKPLLADALSLLRFAAEMEKILNKLRSARQRERFRHTLMKSETEQSVGTSTIETVTVNLIDKRILNVWGTGHWDTSDNAAELAAQIRTGNDALEGDPSSIAYFLGLQGLDASTVWNALPWSWLIDYLSNIGSVLEARKNTLNAKPRDVCIMISDIATETSKVIDNPNGLSYRPHEFIRTSKIRRAYHDPIAMPTLRPILSWKQTSILAALVTAPRMKRVAATL